MKTKILLHRSNPTTGEPFYYITLQEIDSIGFFYSSSTYMITTEQYHTLKIGKEEIYNGTSNNYSVEL